MARHDTHTPAWITFRSASCAAISMAAWGIIYLPLDLWMRGCMAMAALFLVHASTSVTTTWRDRHEVGWPAISAVETSR